MLKMYNGQIPENIRDCLCLSRLFGQLPRRHCVKSTPKIDPFSY